MAYFTSYFTSYFDVSEAGAGIVPRIDVFGISQEEWELYLKKANEAWRERISAEAASRSGLRETLRNAMFPKPPPRAATKPKEQKRQEPEKQTRLQYTPITGNPELDVRIRIAELLLDLQKRTKAKRKAKINKRRKEEAIIIASLY